MSAALQANCPACGGQVNFKQGSSVVVVCEYCNSVVARTDRGLEDLGRVAEVAETQSPLEVGARGVYRETAFELTGRAQLAHAAGGVWDEWYASFADGRWGWLAEAQGRFYLTFRAPQGSAQVPPFQQLELGRAVPGIPVAVLLVAAEKGEARTLAAEGEIPYRLTPNETYAYADLSGPSDTFATIDYGDEPPNVYVGRQVTLTDLGLIDAARVTERASQRVEAAQLSCPQCGGPLDLRAPDQAERVGCPNCGSLLDVNRGRLNLLKALEGAKFEPKVPLGATCGIDALGIKLSGNANDGKQPAADAKLTVIGFMVRSVEFEGVRYFWEEYLLYHPSVGFRWLVQSDNHWSFVETVQPGEVAEAGKRAKFRGQSFKAFQEATARVEYVAGEFYWKVTAGELVRATDYVRAPLLLSKEVSSVVAAAQQAAQGGVPATSAEEINWSLGTYLPRETVEGAFGVKHLPRPTTVAPNQPFPHKKIYRYWLLLLAALLLVGLFMTLAGGHRDVFERTYTLQAQAAPPGVGTTGQTTPEGGSGTSIFDTPSSADAPSGQESTQVIFTEPFQLDARKNVRVSGSANVDNNWLYVAGDIINEETGLVQQFDLPIEYFYGVDGGDSWSEGNREDAAVMSALPAGRYTMRLEAQWEKWNQAGPPQLTVKVEQGVAGGINFVLALLGVSLVPLLVLFRHMSFERRRWADSAFNPYESSE